VHTVARVRVGVALPQYTYSPDFGWEGLSAWAWRAEVLGFDSVWLSDHLFLGIERYGGGAGWYPTFDPFVALGAIAAQTTRVRIGTLVVCSQLRPAAVVANAASSLDHLSGGRLVLGMGAGWFEPEFTAAGVPFRAPRDRLAELAGTLDALRVWWGEGSGVLPPVQRPHPPLWVGGKGGPRLLDVVARHADGWNTVWTWTPEDYADRLAALDAACHVVGRDPRTVTLSVGLYALAGHDEADLRRRFDRLRDRTPPGVLDGLDLERWRQGRLVGTVEEVRAQRDRWAELGVDELVVGLGALPFAVTDAEDLDVLALALTE
jgi:alkanesulfonate monooxygenase SsuD/methylene tetrahydromethanopterin reductase-like flavin-dependent oxidoreductase (luciferase family)